MSELDPQRTAPPMGEEIHMPAPSIIPLINAASLAIAIVSITLSYVVCAVALVVFLITTAKWVADTRRDIDSLPLEHHH
jgi:hypothetical protein